MSILEHFLPPFQQKIRIRFTIRFSLRTELGPIMNYVLKNFGRGNKPEAALTEVVLHPVEAVAVVLVLEPVVAVLVAFVLEPVLVVFEPALLVLAAFEC